MAKIKDRKDHEWLCRLTTKAVRDIKSLHGLDLLNIDSDPMTTLAASPLILIDAAYLICETEAKERGVSDEQFGELMIADECYDAIQEAIVESFPRGRASHVREVLASFQTMREKAEKLAVVKMKGLVTNAKVDKTLSDKADREIEKLLDEIMNDGHIAES